MLSSCFSNKLLESAEMLINILDSALEKTCLRLCLFQVLKKYGKYFTPSGVFGLVGKLSQMKNYFRCL